MPELGEAIKYSLRIPTPVLMSWVTVAVLLVLSAVAAARPRTIPAGLQAGFETVFQFIFSTADSIIGPDARQYYGLFLGLFFFILVGNLIGLVPGLSSPTANLSTTAALALVVFLSTHVLGIRKQGFFRYLAHFSAGVPWWLKPLMTAIEFVSELARPLSLAFRLFGNLMAKEVLLGILAFLVIFLYHAGHPIDIVMTVVPLLLRPLIIILGILVAFLQAYIFTVLAVYYIGGAVRTHS